MNIYRYIVSRDYGFAPNPFYGTCTLATCKATIRKHAQIGDWIIGCGSKTIFPNSIIYLMHVENIITYDEYWENKKYSLKKPIFNGSLKQTFGDNIYHHNNSGEWLQANSHHSLENGKTNFYNLERDTKSDNVLISKEFYYFGKNPFILESKYKSLYFTGRGYIKKIDKTLFLDFIKYFKETHSPGIYSDPYNYDNFVRHNGINS